MLADDVDEDEAGNLRRIGERMLADDAAAGTEWPTSTNGPRSPALRSALRRWSLI